MREVRVEIHTHSFHMYYKKLLTNSDKPTREVNLHFAKYIILSLTKNLIFEPIVYQFNKFALHIITKSTNLNGSFMLRHIVSHM